MPELKKILIAGGGLAGIMSSICALRTNPGCQVQLFEKSGNLLSWINRKGLNQYPLGSSKKVVNPYPDRPEIWQWQKRILEKWDIDRLKAILDPFHEDLFEERDDQFICRNLSLLRMHLEDTLTKLGVEFIFDYSMESVSPQPDGTFRIWSKDGEVLHGHRLILATGGERNHGMKIVRDMGMEVRTPVPAFVRLRLASPKLGDRMGPLEREVSVRCLKSGIKAAGRMKISSRGLEGEAISNLSAVQCDLWNKLDYSIKIEVDWLPERSGASLLKEICSRKELGGKREIADTPMFSFPIRSWNTLLKSARIEGDTPWSKIKMKKLQALANRIKTDRITVSGMGLPQGERAWTGGANLESLNQQNLESNSIPALYLAGEILNMHGMPCGNHQNLILATACVAGCAAAG